MKNTIKTVVLGLVSVFLASIFTSCKDTSNQNVSYIYTGTQQRPTDIPELELNKYVTYPEKPSEVIESDKTKSPYLGKAVNSKDGLYKITNSTNIQISYDDVAKWSYVYIPIENYHSEYSNIKMTVSSNGSEKIAIQAIYYEMYEQNYVPITVYQKDIVDGEQYFIIRFNKPILDGAYNVVSNEELSKKCIVGLCLFIDSNPTQLSSLDPQGSLSIDKCEFLKDGDSALQERYVDPAIKIGYLDEGYKAKKDENTNNIEITRDANTNFWTRAGLSVSNYTSSYTSLKFKYTSTGVKKIRLSLEFNTLGNTWQPTVDLYTEEITDGTHEKEIDFSDAQPISSLPPYDYVPGYYIKNYKITNIFIYLDTYEESVIPDFEAKCNIENISFIRTEDDGSINVSKAWATNTSSIQILKDVINGGTGSVEYCWYSGWDYLSMPIKNYVKTRKIIIKFEAKEKIAHLGIAVVAGKEFVIRPSDALLNGNNSEIGNKTGEVEGLKEIVEYDETNKIYTITFDFKNIVGLQAFENKKLNELNFTSFRFYLNDPNETDIFTGTRILRFINIEFQ